MTADDADEGYTPYTTDNAAYIAAWNAFLDQVRAAHPEAPIVITEPVQLSDVPGTPRQKLRAQLREDSHDEGAAS